MFSYTIRLSRIVTDLAAYMTVFAFAGDYPSNVIETNLLDFAELPKRKELSNRAELAF